MLPPGLEAAPTTIRCGGDDCRSSSVVGVVNVAPCCDEVDACGLSTAFLALAGTRFSQACQAHAQPGFESSSCPAATGLVVPFPMGATTLQVPLDPFPGCCRPDGTCGVVVDRVTAAGGKLPLADLDLGCVEGAPFFEGVVSACDESVGGAGGSSGGAGSGGAGNDAGGAPATPAGGAG